MPANPKAELTLMVLEGDADNIFNSTVNTGATCRAGVTGVDLDRSSAGEAVVVRNKRVTVELFIPVGNGFMPAEQTFTNWLILSVETELL